MCLLPDTILINVRLFYTDRGCAKRPLNVERQKGRQIMSSDIIISHQSLNTCLIFAFGISWVIPKELKIKFVQFIEFPL